MDTRTRIVVRLPLTELWTEDGRVEAVQVRRLSRSGIAGLLRDGPVQLVRAEIGRPLEWIPAAERFDLWKSEIQDRVVDPADAGFVLDDYPDGYCYAAALERGRRSPDHPPRVPPLSAERRLGPELPKELTSHGVS